MQHTIVLITERYNIFCNGNYILQLHSLIILSFEIFSSLRYMQHTFFISDEPGSCAAVGCPD